MTRSEIEIAFRKALFIPKATADKFTRDEKEGWIFLTEHFEKQFHDGNFSGCEGTLQEMQLLIDTAILNWESRQADKLSQKQTELFAA